MITNELLNSVIPLTDEIALLRIKIQIEKKSTAPREELILKYDELIQQASNDIIKILMDERAPIIDDFAKNVLLIND